MSRRTVVIGLVVAFLAIAVILRSRGDSPTPSATASPPDPIAATDTAMTRFAPSREPAEAVLAAESVIRQTGAVATAGFITRTDLIRSLATERFGPTLAAESSGQLSEMTQTLGAAQLSTDQIKWTEYPLASHTVSSTTDEVVVAVWAVLVVGVHGVGAPRQVWRTVTMTMRWERDAWRVDGWSTESGPTPALAANAPISSVADVAVVADWEPSSVGGNR